MNYTIDNDGRFTRYTFQDKNSKGESLVIEVCKVFPDNSYRRSLPRLWKKAGYTNKLYNSYLTLKTYVTGTDNLCRGKYNPTLIDDGKRFVINFDRLYEVNEENEKKLVDETYDLFMTA